MIQVIITQINVSVPNIVTLLVSFNSNQCDFISRDIEKIKEAGINNISVSFDSIDPSKHDKNRGVEGAFNKAIEGIRISKAQGIRTGIAFSYDKQNVYEAEDIIKMAISNSVEEVSLMKKRSNFKLKLRDTNLTTIENNYIVDLYKKYNSKNMRILTHDVSLLNWQEKLGMNESDKEKFITQNECHFLNNKICITAEGGILGCSFSAKPVFKIGEPEDLLKVLSDNTIVNTNCTSCIVDEAEQ